MGETLGKQTNSLLLKIILITFDEPFDTTPHHHPPEKDEEGKSFANSIFIPATSSLSSGFPSFVPQPHLSSTHRHRIITRPSPSPHHHLLVQPVERRGIGIPCPSSPFPQPPTARRTLLHTRLYQHSCLPACLLVGFPGNGDGETVR